MAHKVVKYTLTADGTIPAFLKFGVTQNTGGMYPVHDELRKDPQDVVMIGISDDGADITDAVEEITTQADLETYLSAQATANGWMDLDSDQNEVAFDAAAHAQAVWDDLTALNA